MKIQVGLKNMIYFKCQRLAISKLASQVRWILTVNLEVDTNVLTRNCGIESPCYYVILHTMANSL